VEESLVPVSLFGCDKLEPAAVLEAGWQLYARPTTLEPVGTLFRIDERRRRFIVEAVAVETREGTEAAAKVKQRLQANICCFARFLGLDSYRGRLSARNAETLEFEIVSPFRQFASDAAMEKALAPALARFEYRAGNRYYVIRETRSATAMTYRLTQAQLGEIGGEASLAAALGAGAKLGAGQSGRYEINQSLPHRMRVMFLAEEIAPVKVGLAGSQPVLGRRPVREPLVWSEG
jgi:hypothetical protein